MGIYVPPDETIYHWVDWDQPGRRDARAICGNYVDRYVLHRNDPNCPTCARLLADRRRNEHKTAAEMFGVSDPSTAVHSTLSDPLDGYTPKGTKR